MAKFLFALALLLLSCTDHGPASANLQADRPLLRSDTLLNILIGFSDRTQQAPLTGDRDVDVITELIEHHRTAIQMNTELQREGSNEELDRFADRLTETFEKEIEQMQAFLEHHPPVSGMGRRGAPDMLADLGTLEPTDDLDQAYVQMMRIHLRYGIGLARTEHERGLHDDMRTAAGEMVKNSEALLAELDRLGG